MNVKANKVIYFNEASGKLELCSNGDVYNIAELNIYGHKYIPQRHLEKLILDKKVTYTRFSKGLSLPLKIVSTKNDFFRQFTDRYFSLEFSVLSIDDEQIIINCSEKVDLANGKYGGIRFNLFDYPSIGKIKFIRRKDMLINGVTGDAAIIIYDVGAFANTAYSIGDESAGANLGRFATSIGLSLFVEMDGDWNKIIGDAERHLMSAGEKLDNAKKENDELKHANKVKEDAIKNLSQQNEELKTELQSYQEELAKTRKWAYDILHFNREDTEEFDVTNEEDWGKFQSKVLELTEKMKEDSLKSDKKNRLKSIKSAFAQKYKKFDETDLSFLATGQYLLEAHKDDNMDFSPVLIAFSKCVEGVLARYLKKVYVIPEDEMPMLGNSLKCIKNKENSLLLDLTQSQAGSLVKQLDEFIKYRNMAAHKEGISLEDLLNAKEIIFNNLDSFNKKYLLDFIHFKF